MKYVISGIGLLDLTSATKESLGPVNCIKGVGCVLLGEGNTAIVSGIEQSGIGATVVIPKVEDAANVITKTGMERFGGEFFKNLVESTVLILTGIVILENGITAQDLKNLKNIYGAGILICPEDITGVINGLSSGFTGFTVPYKKQAKIETGNITVNNEYLAGLQEGTSILHLGNVVMTGDMDTALYQSKIDSIYYLGNIIACEKFSKLLANATGQGQIIYIPDGYNYLGSDQTITADSRLGLEHERWYLDGTLYIREDVTPGILEESLDAIHCDTVVYPKALVQTVKKLLAGQTKHLPYTNKLRVYYEEHILTAAQLEAENMPVNLMVYCKLKIADDVTQKLLEEKIEKIDNYGSIFCTEAMYPAVSDKLRENQGLITAATDDAGEEEIQVARGIGYLKL